MAGDVIPFIILYFLVGVIAGLFSNALDDNRFAFMTFLWPLALVISIWRGFKSFIFED